MAKRFTDSNKWDDPWFLDLSPEYKLAWDYITSKCDSVGVWKPSIKLLNFNVGEMDIRQFLTVCGERVFIMDNGNWWIVKFCDFQYGALNEQDCYGEKSDGTKYVKNKPHFSYISLLKKHSLWIAYTKGIHTLKDKEKEKVKEKDKDNKGVQGEIYRSFLHLKLTVSEFESLNQKYTKEQIDKTLDSIQNYRKNINYTSLFLTCSKWLEKDARDGPKSNIITALNISDKQDLEIAAIYKK